MKTEFDWSERWPGDYYGETLSARKQEGAPDEDESVSKSGLGLATLTIIAKLQRGIT